MILLIVAIPPNSRDHKYITNTVQIRDFRLLLFKNKKYSKGGNFGVAVHRISG